MKRRSHQKFSIDRERLTKEQLSGDDLIGGEMLSAKLDYVSMRTLAEMRRKRLIPFIKLGRKTIRYSWPRVQAALARLEIRAIGDEK